MQQLTIPVPADKASYRTILANAHEALKAAGFAVWGTTVVQEQDGTITAIRPKVVFTNRPGSPWRATQPGTVTARRAAYRSVAKRLGVRGLSPVICRP